MLNCKQASHLVSQSLDRRLSFAERFGLRLHLLICAGCRQFSQQLAFMRDALAHWHRKIESDASVTLPKDARQRIGEAMANRVRHQDQHTS